MGQAKLRPGQNPYHVRRRVSVVYDPEEGMTKQSFKDETDINNIVGLYVNTGQFPNARQQDPVFADAPDLTFKEALDCVKASREEFNNLSPEIQEKFGQNSDNYFAVLGAISDMGMETFLNSVVSENETADSQNSQPSAEPSETSKNGDS